MRSPLWFVLTLIVLLGDARPLEADASFGPPLRDQLLTTMASGSSSHPVVDQLLSDYVTYHLVFLVVGGTALTLLAIVSGFLFWLFSVLPTFEGRWGFRRSVALGLGLFFGLVGLGLALVTLANASTVRDPGPGFRGAVSSLRDPDAGSRAEKLQHAYASWLESDGTEVPAAVLESVKERLSWQAPKAWASLGLLLLSCLMSLVTWRRLGKRFATSPWLWDSHSMGLLVPAVVSTLAIPLLLAMVIGNVQGTLAPLALSLFFA